MCVDKMKNLEIIPDILSMYSVFTSQSTFHNRQEMSITAKMFHIIYCRLYTRRREKIYKLSVTLSDQTCFPLGGRGGGVTTYI